ncbi:MAG TPA: hypothetical protein VGT61_12970 [Thermomicrobiales bacterium]|jgi:hypothetical protein|nr:hypothetical protein [Thermomicrobiales bacterium]
MSDSVEPVPVSRWSLRRVIIMAGLVIAGAALVVMLLVVISDQGGSGATGTQTPAPIVFPTTTINR